MHLFFRVTLVFFALCGVGASFAFGAMVREVEPGRTELAFAHLSVRRVAADATEPRLWRHAFLMEQAFYDAAFDGAEMSCPEGATGAIVNHHLLAKSFIAEAVACLDADTRTVILIAPNHFSRGGGAALVSAAGWRTPYGDLLPDTATIEALAADGAVAVDEEPFALEHSIGNIVAFLRKAMPRARIVPIILKDAHSPEEAVALAAALEKRLPKKSTIVASIDFSHEATAAMARFHDAKSLRVIENGDVAGLSPLDIDSEPSLRTLLDLMGRRETASFHLLRRSDSTTLTGIDADDATSYITGVFTPGAATSRKSATALFVGDVMLDRDVKTMLERKGMTHVLGLSRRMLRGSDLTVANLEGPVSVAPPAHDPVVSLHFIFEAKFLPALRSHGITDVSLANNHTLNNRDAGLDETRMLLGEADIRHFGDPRNAEGTAQIVERGGVKIALVGHHRFSGKEASTLAEIARVRPLADVVLVMPHWGTEYSAVPTEDQRRQAHAFIDAGADAVIGAHPHVIQPVEVYEGKAIFYSLGNFVFDQTFSKATMQGLAVGVVMDEGAMTYTVAPIAIARDLRTGPMPAKDRATLLSKLAADSAMDDVLKAALAKGEFSLPRN